MEQRQKELSEHSSGLRPTAFIVHLPALGLSLLSGEEVQCTETLLLEKQKISGASLIHLSVTTLNHGEFGSVG